MTTSKLSSSQQSRKQYSDSDAAFIDAIQSFANNIKEADEVSSDLRDIFFKCTAKRNSLPDGAPRDTIDNFLTSLILMMGANVNQPLHVKSLEVLFRFIKNGKW